jgi:predicted RNA-binding Zn ribbon-like protein
MRGAASHPPLSSSRQSGIRARVKQEIAHALTRLSRAYTSIRVRRGTSHDSPNRVLGTDRLRCATELTDLVTDVGPERIRECEAAPCIEVFVDSSRNGRRVYCSRRCANRVNASRHRQRGSA